jgi:hypothetical protein
MIGTARQRIVPTMRRALVLITVLLATLLGTGLAGGGPDSAAAFHEEQEDVIFSLKAEGFTVEVLAEDNDGEQTARMDITRAGLAHGGLLAQYTVPATLTDHSLTAKFGALGELNYEFSPRKCKGGLDFTGSFVFTGENGYIKIEADHATGSYVADAYSACGPLGPVDFSKVRQIDSRLNLLATAGSIKNGTARTVQALETTYEKGPPRVQISGFVGEEREGMTVARGALVGAPLTAFHANRKAGTATLRPPAPFVGSATLRPGRGGKKFWRGSLRLPDIAGGPPIVLTGPDFHASLSKEYPTEERPAARAAASPERVAAGRALRSLSVGIVEVARTSIRFDFHQGPFLVYVEMLGPGNRLALTVIRRGMTATYATTPHFEGDRVRARFGRLGALDLTFTPTPGKAHKCGTIVTAQGVFAGRLEFTGEHHYIHLDVHRVKGERTSAGSCSSPRPAVAARPGPTLRADESEATLTARAAAPHARESLTAVMERDLEGEFRGIIAAFRWEHEGGMEIIRGTQMGIGRDRFKWDLKAGTADLSPTAPFSGSATLARAADGRRRLTGTLRLPILGGSPLVLTGPRWKVGLRAGAIG